MIIDSAVTGDAMFPDVRFRVSVHEELERVTDPRDHWEGASDIDVAMWRDDLWSFVWVKVVKLHTCPGCDDEHETDDGASLGMVAFGSGDGWSVGMSEIVSDLVPDLIKETMEGN